jgi:GT2 family glycosyltransferase
MKLLVAIPTLSRADLLSRNKTFLESIQDPDRALLVDNGNQKIDIDVPIIKPGKNLGVSGSWNLFLRQAFIDGNYDALVILQDDIIWNREKFAIARWLLLANPDVDLFLSNLQWSVQIHRPTNITTVGYFDEQFWPGYCEDDDYAIRMTRAGRIYQRFHELDPLPGSIHEGTKKSVPWQDQFDKLKAKWGDQTRGANIPGVPWYETNRGLKLP